jgi:hypothetical protein
VDLGVEGEGGRLCILQTKFNEFLFNLLSLMDVKLTFNLINIHSQEERSQPKLLNFELLFDLSLESKGVSANDH